MAYIDPRGYFNAPALANITPFSYSDNYTYLDLLEKMRDNLDELNKNYNSISDNINHFTENFEKYSDDHDAAIKAELADRATKLKDDINRIRDDISNFKAVIGKTAICSDPTNGLQNETVSEAVSRVYDYSRVYAWFAGDLGVRDMTAHDLDAENVSARRHDLYGAGKINVEFGDYRKV